MPWAIEDYDSDRKSPPFSALIMNPESGAYFAMDLFVIGPRFPVFSPFQLCLDCALTCQDRPESIPDSELSDQKSGVFFRGFA